MQIGGWGQPVIWSGNPLQVVLDRLFPRQRIVRTCALFNHPAAPRASKRLYRIVLALLHHPQITLRAVLFDNGDALAAVDAVWRDGVPAEVGDGFDWA